MKFNFQCGGIKSESKKIILVLIPLFIFSCIKNPLPPKLPSWNTQLTIPLVDRTFTLEDFMKKTSTMTTDSIGGLVYEPIPLTNKPDTIHLPKFTTSPAKVSQKIGPIEWPDVMIPPSTTTFKNLTGVDPPILPYPNPDFSGTFTKDVDLDIGGQLDIFDYGVFEDGAIELTFINTFLFGFNFTNGLVLKNRDDNSIIGTYSAFTLNAGETKKIIAVVSGKTLKDKVRIEGNFQTISVTGKLITGLNAIAVASKVFGSSGSGKASLSEAKILFAGNIELVNLPNESDQLMDDSTFYKTLEFSDGGFDLKVTNSSNLGVRVNFEIKEFRSKANNQPFYISGNSKTAEINPKSIFNRSVLLKDYKLESQEAANQPTNKMNFSINIKTLVPGLLGKIVVNKNDSVVAEIIPKKDEFGKTIPYKLHKVHGKIKPTTVSVNSSMPFVTGEMSSKFKADSILVDSIYLSLKLFTSGLFPIDIALKIYAVNKDGSFGDSLKYPSGNTPKRINPGEIDSIVFDKTNSTLDRFISSFLSAGGSGKFLPDSLRIIGKFVVNPIDVYKDPNAFGGATEGDTVVTGVKFSFPMRLGIKNGTLRDTSVIGDTTSSGTGTSKFDKSTIEDVIQGKILFSVENTFPIQIQIKAGLFDNKINSTKPDTVALMYLPMGSDTILVDSARYSQSPVKPGKSFNTFSMTPNDVDKFNPAKFMTLAINLRTSGNGNKAVVFKKDNYLKIKSFASVTYNVNFEKKKK